MSKNSLVLKFTLDRDKIKKLANAFQSKLPDIILYSLTIVSIFYFLYFFQNGLGLAYNDARSHLNIGRRVVEGLKPGFAQIGSVWLPLPHVLMIPTVWSDFFWHTGLSGAIQSMVSFVITGLVIYKFLEALQVGVLGRIFAILVFVLNLNILYLQSIAMTELLLLATMTTASYHLLLWFKTNKLEQLIFAAFFVMLSTLVRYDGWFLLFFSALLVSVTVLLKKGYKVSEGVFILFCTLGGFGIFLWLLWNTVIFKDPLFFAFGQFSARAQQPQLEEAGILASKHNLWLSMKIYLYALIYNSGALVTIFGFFGMILLALDKKLSREVKIGALVLIAPFLFNVLALYLGHSVLFIQGISGTTWFNVRYGIMMMPSLAIFSGFLMHKLKPLRPVITGLFVIFVFFTFVNQDAVTIDDATVGSSQKNVSEVSNWLKDNAQDEKGFILISAASHDAIIFSSSIPMKRFIHEGTGDYWDRAISNPDRWARWIVLRTYDDNDLTYKGLKNSASFSEKYKLVDHYPFADIYQLEEQYVGELNTEPILANKNHR